MVFNALSVGGAVTPAVISIFFSHFLNPSERKNKPTAHISYDEGINLIRRFLLYASNHTVEDVQRFTAQWVPHPRWVKVDEVAVDEKFIQSAAEYIQVQLGANGIERVGGKTWWQWRRPGHALCAEWIEMRADYNERKKTGDKGQRVMLYVHGGAYFFGSVDEHRYQLQRHARKLKARVFAPRYRLAPQFPFPCGLHDVLAAYLHLLSVQEPETIILAGDSAGGGMIMSLLVILRDRGLPLPAGAILISPWVDLTHSFPSVAADNPLDYIPPYGFHHKPSPAWPPPNSDDLLALKKGLALEDQSHATKAAMKDAAQGVRVIDDPPANMKNADAGTAKHDGANPVANTVPGAGTQNLSVMIDGELVEIKDQIQMYTTNSLVNHPLVSPILQPSLGGLPPLLILTGGGEMLRDEQIYLAHKAANPEKYPPGDAFLDDSGRSQIKRWNPTDVQLQVWDDLCHVAPTLSFTHPAKYMYRSVAQFGAWALARAQRTSIEMLDDDDDVSHVSTSSDDTTAQIPKEQTTPKTPTKHGQIGRAGEPLPPFKSHMLRQRVDVHGAIYPLESAELLPSCNIPCIEVGIVKPGPVRKWMEAKKRWDTKFATAKRAVQQQRIKEMAKEYQTYGDGEVPPPSALAGRIQAGKVRDEKQRTKSIGMAFWSMKGSKHDKDIMDREEHAGKQPETVTVTGNEGAGARALEENEKTHIRHGSRRRNVTDEHQTGSGDGNDPAEPVAEKAQSSLARNEDHLSPNFDPSRDSNVTSQDSPNGRLETDLRRPKLDGIAFPFSLKQKDENSSMLTLTSAEGIDPASEGRSALSGDGCSDDGMQRGDEEQPR